MVHIYHGDGKGKTTAAMGLALRALGHGQRVAVVQFLKDGTSGELAALANLSGATVLAPRSAGKFTFQMTAEELNALKAEQEGLLAQARGLVEAKACDLLVLDEVLDALSTGTLDAAVLMDLLHGFDERAEMVLTGRNPSAELLALADYVTEMRCEKHPYQRGVAARVGVEF